MDKKRIKNDLELVLNTLEEISVKGKKNLVWMAGVMNCLEDIKGQLNDDIKAEEEKKKAEAEAREAAKQAASTKCNVCPPNHTFPMPNREEKA